MFEYGYSLADSLTETHTILIVVFVHVLAGYPFDF